MAEVSLGIQLCDKIKTYTQDYKTRDEQLGRVLHRAVSLKELLEHLHQLADESTSTQPEISAAVSRHIAACEADIRALDELTAKLVPKAPAPGDGGIKGKMKEEAKRLAFPFNRADVDKLEAQLDKTIQTLSLAVSGLQLRSQASLLGGQEAIASGQGDIISGQHGIASSQAMITSGQAALAVGQARMHGDLDNLGNKMEEQFQQMFIMIQSLSTASTPLPQTKETVTLALASPSALQEACNFANQAPVAEGSGQLRQQHRQIMDGKPCGCRRRRLKYSRSSSPWFSFSVLDETTEDKTHRSDCLYARIRPTETSRLMTLTFSGLRSYLSTAISIGFYTSRGAGGYSISPVLRYQRTVESATSPAFKVVDVVTDSWYFLGRLSPVVEKALVKLRDIYATGQAFPTDLDEDGATVLTRFSFNLSIFVINIKPSQRDPDAWRFVNRLLDFDVPTQGVGSKLSAMSAAAWIFKRSCFKCYPDFDYAYTEPLEWQEKWERLLAYAEEDDWGVHRYGYGDTCPLFRIRGGSRALLERVAIGSYYDMHAAAGNILADPTGYGLESDLAMALVLRDDVLLQKALSRGESSPRPLKENGIDLLDFVMLWPRALQMILDQPTATDMKTYLDSGYALYSALEVSSRLCNVGEDTHIKPCNDCSCSRSLEILLERQGPLLIDQIPWYACSWKAMYTLLSHIKYWREKLAGLARAELAPEDQASLGLNTDSVLDGNASRANKLLHSRGIDPAMRLGLTNSDGRLQISSKYQGQSVYHHLGDPTAAEVAYSLGFRDIDFPDENGNTPLAKVVSSWLVNNIKCIRWLVDKGANVGRVTYDSHSHADLFPNHTLVHRVMFEYEWDGRDSDSFHFAVGILRQVTAGDGFGCACSDPEHGPSPLNVFIWRFIGKFTHKRELVQAVEFLSAQIHADEVVAAMFSKPIIRLLAFNALEIRHTCCLGIADASKTFDWWRCRLEGCTVCDWYADLEEIRDEDAAAHEILEQLVAKLYACFESHGLPVFAFMEQVGWGLIQEVVDALNGAELTEAEREGMEKVCVRLALDSSPTEEDEVDDTSARGYTDGTLEFWLRKLDEI